MYLVPICRGLFAGINVFIEGGMDANGAVRKLLVLAATLASCGRMPRTASPGAGRPDDSGITMFRSLGE